MAEEAEGLDSGEANAGVDPFAAAVALGGASRAKADAFLEEQRKLAIDQRHHLHEQFKNLRLTIWEKRTGVLLRAATAVVGLAVAGFFGLMLWDAANSNGLIIEPFAVPADMAAKGLTGQVVASQMLDKLTLMQDATNSGRPPQSYANNWGDDIKVEIPETGVSIGELQQFLKGWLGHDTHISGEVWRTETGIAVSAREGSEAGATFTGAESELDGLVQKAAEHVYGATQPYRYANFLDRAYDAPDIADRAARASVIYRKLIAGPSAVEQAWAWNGLATIAGQIENNNRAAVYDLQKSVAANPDFTIGWYGVALREPTMGHHEKALSAGLKAKSLLDRKSVPDINPSQLTGRRLANDFYLATDKGDFMESVRLIKIAAGDPEAVTFMSANGLSAYMARDLADLHDGTGIRGTLRDLGISSIEKIFGRGTAVYVAFDLEDWPTVLEIEKAIPESTRQQTYRAAPIFLALVAVAHAHMGDVSGAEALIAPSPDDCDDCVIARGLIAEMEGQHARADDWFARVEKAEPSVPFADAYWGQALLGRGDADAAIAKFTLANQKGPHFADPLEGWGEALMKKNQSHLALAKFEGAEKYAPNWGRLHLKWGEALFYAGKADEAKKQFALAAGLDLTAADKAELAKVSAHG